MQTLLGTWLLASAVFLLSRSGDDYAPLPSNDLLLSAASATDMQASRVAIRHRLGLDLPLFYFERQPNGSWQWQGWHNQYHRWLRALGHGSMGTSFRTAEPVTRRLARALALTLPLTATAAGLAALAALALARRLATGVGWPPVVRAALVALQALPLFVVALALLLLLANPDMLNWLPADGMTSVTVEFSPAFLRHMLPRLVLPVVALVLAVLPELTLQLDDALAHELQQPYALTARAKGLPAAAVVRHHAFRNAMLPTLAQLAELLPAIVAGAVVAEAVFALPGMGRLLAEAAATRDYPVLVGSILLIGLARLVSLLVADASYAWADPRIRWQA